MADLTDDDVTAALRVIERASAGPATWQADPDDTEETAVARFLANYRRAREVTNSSVSHQVAVTADDGGRPFLMAITGNGPTSEANARYIAGSLDPVAGWKAALLEVRRQRAEQAAGRENVERVVNEACRPVIALSRGISLAVAGDMSERIARRVADRLSVPVTANTDTDLRIKLWDAINAYAVAVGGCPSSQVYGNTKRQQAVVAIETVISGRLSAPVLSAEDAAALTLERDGLSRAADSVIATPEHTEAMRDRVAMLDRLIAGAKP